MKFLGFLVYIIKGLPLDTVILKLTHSLRIPLTPSPWTAVNQYVEVAAETVLKGVSL